MSEVKVNKVSPRSGTTVTIGDSGDTINIVGTLQNNGSALTGDISSVVAGTGLSGGATSGVATLNIEAAQPTITSLGTITGFTSTGIDDNATSTAITIDSNENVGIGGVPPTVNQRLFIEGNNSALIMAEIKNIGGPVGLQLTADNGDAARVVFGDLADNGRGRIVYSNSDESMSFAVNNLSEKMRITSAGNLGIGLTNPTAKLHVQGSGTTAAIIKSLAPSTAASVGAINNSGTEGKILVFGSSQGSFGSIGSGEMALYSTSAGMSIINNNASGNIKFSLSSGAEKMRIDSSGNLLVGTTSANPGIGNTNTGFSVTNSGGQVGNIAISQNGNYSANFNRNTSNGTIVQFSKNGTAQGVIGSNGNFYIADNSGYGFSFDDGAANIYPCNSSGTVQNNVVDLGHSTYKWKDLHLGGGVYLGGNKLDDYEEGTWTPSVGGTSLGTGTGIYRKIGKICLVHFGNRNISQLTNNSNTTITGLPFSMASSVWESTSTPSMTFADSSGGYHAFPLTGRQDSNGNVTMVNRSGITLESNDPVNFSMVYSTN